jgi:hypothetical protein
MGMKVSYLVVILLLAGCAFYGSQDNTVRSYSFTSN